MARLSVALLVVALLQLGSSLPIVEATQDLSALPDSSSPSLTTGVPVHQPHLHQPHPASKQAVLEKRSLPVAPEWLRWLPFEKEEECVGIGSISPRCDALENSRNRAAIGQGGDSQEMKAGRKNDYSSTARPADLVFYFSYGER
ncbi:hypothetical protein GGS24DRAFT_506339 [Hypoxylon argillaceum]|nr:hypothetical protein GGS24DRAFT_506339 [Hypoxylon argillaceum]